MVHKARCHMAKMLSEWIPSEAALGERGGRWQRSGSDGWRPALGGAIGRRLSPTVFLKTRNIAGAGAAISAAVGETDGHPGAYCALSSGAALWKYDGGNSMLRVITRGKWWMPLHAGQTKRHQRGAGRWATMWRRIIQPTTSHLVGSQALT